MVRNDWLSFFELVERLQSVSPELVELALRYSRGADQAVLEKVARELGSQSGQNSPQNPFFDESQKINLRRCQDFLEELRKQEDDLRNKQLQATQGLGQIQTARRAFENTLKAMLQAERRSFASDQWTDLHATEEEVVAGLQELKEKGGVELHQFIGELEQAVHNGERTGK